MPHGGSHIFPSDEKIVYGAKPKEMPGPPVVPEGGAFGVSGGGAAAGGVQYTTGLTTPLLPTEVPVQIASLDDIRADGSTHRQWIKTALEQSMDLTPVDPMTDEDKRLAQAGAGVDALPVVDVDKAEAAARDKQAQIDDEEIDSLVFETIQEALVSLREYKSITIEDRNAIENNVIRNLFRIDRPGLRGKAQEDPEFHALQAIGSKQEFLAKNTLVFTNSRLFADIALSAFRNGYLSPEAYDIVTSGRAPTFLVDGESRPSTIGGVEAQGFIEMLGGSLADLKQGMLVDGTISNETGEAGAAALVVMQRHPEIAPDLAGFLVQQERRNQRLKLFSTDSTEDLRNGIISLLPRELRQELQNPTSDPARRAIEAEVAELASRVQEYREDLLQDDPRITNNNLSQAVINAASGLIETSDLAARIDAREAGIEREDFITDEATADALVFNQFPDIETYQEFKTLFPNFTTELQDAVSRQPDRPISEMLTEKLGAPLAQFEEFGYFDRGLLDAPHITLAQQKAIREAAFPPAEAQPSFDFTGTPPPSFDFGVTPTDRPEVKLPGVLPGDYTGLLPLPSGLIPAPPPPEPVLPGDYRGPLPLPGGGVFVTDTPAEATPPFFGSDPYMGGETPGLFEGAPPVPQLGMTPASVVSLIPTPTAPAAAPTTPAAAPTTDIVPMPRIPQIRTEVPLGGQQLSMSPQRLEAPIIGTADEAMRRLRGLSGVDPLAVTRTVSEAAGENIPLFNFMLGQVGNVIQSDYANWAAQQQREARAEAQSRAQNFAEQQAVREGRGGFEPETKTVAKTAEELLADPGGEPTKEVLTGRTVYKGEPPRTSDYRQAARFMLQTPVASFQEFLAPRLEGIKSQFALTPQGMQQAQRLEQERQQVQRQERITGLTQDPGALGFLQYAAMGRKDPSGALVTMVSERPPSIPRLSYYQRQLPTEAGAFIETGRPKEEFVPFLREREPVLAERYAFSPTGIQEEQTLRESRKREKAQAETAYEQRRRGLLRRGGRTIFRQSPVSPSRGS